MASKATQEYRASFITLLSQLSELEKKGKDFFDEIENSVFVPHDAAAAKADYDSLLASLHALELQAKNSGLLSISGQTHTTSTSTTPQEQQPTTRNLATRNAETLQKVESFFQEKNRLLMNIRAAVNASALPISSTSTTSNTNTATLT